MRYNSLRLPLRERLLIHRRQSASDLLLLALDVVLKGGALSVILLLFLVPLQHESGWKRVSVVTSLAIRALPKPTVLTPLKSIQEEFANLSR